MLCCAVAAGRSSVVLCPPSQASKPVHDLQIREKDWCNVITAHHGDSAAYTWRLQNFTLGEHALKPPKSKKRKADKSPEGEEQAAAAVTAVGMSQCGNYGLVGRASGMLDRYNMQSGLHRGSYTRYMTVGLACFLTVNTGPHACLLVLDHTKRRIQADVVHYASLFRVSNVTGLWTGAMTMQCQNTW